MGYRSDVASGIFASTDEALTGLVSAARLAGIEIDTIKEFSRVKFNDCTFALIYQASNVKWYDSYTEVQQHHGFLAFAEERGFASAFIRIGEETDDNQAEYHAPDEADAPGYDIYPSEFISIHRAVDVYTYVKLGEGDPL